MVVSTAFFYKTASYKFVFNDFYTVVNDNDIKDITSKGVKHIFSGAIYENYHPLRKLAYGLIYKHFGLSPKPYHVFNVAVNSLNAALVFFLCVLLLSNAYSRSPLKTDMRVGPIIFASLAAALVFVFHPVHVETVAYVSSLKELLSSFFTLLSLICFVHLRTGGKEKTPSWFFHLSLLFFIAACLTRPAMVFLPLAMIFFDGVYPLAARRTPLSQRAGEYFFFLSATVFVVGLNHALGLKAGLFYDHAYDEISSHVILTAKSFVFYLYKSISPGYLSVIYDMGSVKQFSGAIAVATLAAFGIVSVALARIKPLLSFGMLFFIASISPALYLAPIKSTPSETILYLPVAGLCIAFSVIVHRLLSSKSIILTLVACASIIAVLTSFSLISSRRLPVWTDNISLWRETLTTENESPIALTAYAGALRVKGDYDAAHIYIQKSLTLDPYYSKSYIELSLIYKDENMVQSSLHAIKEGFKHDIKDIEIHYYYGVALYDSGQIPSAARILVYVERSYPGFLEVRSYLKTILRLARRSMSEEEFIKMVENLKLPETIEF